MLYNKYGTPLANWSYYLNGNVQWVKWFSRHGSVEQDTTRAIVLAR